jgi:hypothetical protein
MTRQAGCLVSWTILAEAAVPPSGLDGAPTSLRFVEVRSLAITRCVPTRYAATPSPRLRLRDFLHLG